MTKKEKKQFEDYIDKKINVMKSEIAQSVRNELDHLLTIGTVQAINRTIQDKIEKQYAVKLSVGLINT